MAQKGKNQECVAIAQDVLRQLNANQYVATTGVYLREADGSMDLRSVRGDLQAILMERKPKCEVCAIGSLFLSSVFQFDDFTGDGHFIDDDDMRGKLQGFFTYCELEGMENAFENFDNDDRLAENEDTDDQRMRRIMQYVIDNNGSFELEAFISTL